MVASIKPGTSTTHRAPEHEDVEGQVQGLTPEQLTVLAQKVYDLLLEELRIEKERHGGIGSR
jgi:hypothetical protein